QEDIARLTLADARKYMRAGEFPCGSMGPKIQAAVQFLEAGGEKVLITSVEKHIQALEGQTGTLLLP
ncbi:MAG: carbamate kinase, partial [Planctomycetota bacterium]